ncbi:MAG: hypothetical protein LRY50_10735, partial [Geovibrio sp.]|nr:hypothetical protein [Geovibrio sp.]
GKKPLLNRHLNGERLTRKRSYNCQSAMNVNVVILKAFRNAQSQKCPLNPFNPYSDSLNLSAQAD